MPSAQPLHAEKRNQSPAWAWQFAADEHEKREPSHHRDGEGNILGVIEIAPYQVPPHCKRDGRQEPCA